jgi:hypothetical protein
MQDYWLAIVGIAGALLGTLVSALMSRLAEDRRWRRELQAEERRWEGELHAEKGRWERERQARRGEDRLVACTHYLALVGRIYHRIIVYWGMHPEGVQSGSDEYQGLVKQLTLDGFEAASQLALLGTAGVGTKADEVQRVLYAGLGKLTKEEQSDFKNRYAVVRAEFIEIVREELGLGDELMS